LQLTLEWCDFLLHGSGPSLVAARDVAAFLSCFTKRVEKRRSAEVRKNAKLRCAPTEAGECWRTDERGNRWQVQLRRWAELHFEEAATTVLDVVRVDDPKYDKPLLLGSTARELRLEEFLWGYECRPTIETNFYVGQDSCALEMPRALTEQAVTRRINLALLAGALLKELAARGPALALGPWDRQPQRSGGRLAHYLSQHAAYLAELALAGLPVRNYRKKSERIDNKGLTAPACRLSW
jgi:hypothetical protein